MNASTTATIHMNREDTPSAANGGIATLLLIFW